MFTDTVGYTASTHADEGHTLDMLRQQEELVRPLLAVHQGREIKSTGDGFLVEFDSALKATQCALNIQRRIYERNAEGGLVPIQIRIGIHLGDVVQRGSDILGDAVNIAARIEPIAEPGGICLSGAVYEQVRNKILDKLEKLPPTALKGLEPPMDIYRIVLPWTVRPPPSPSSGPTRLAVLPFANISPDPNDEYFADGLTEEMITVLSQLRELRVIARTSVNQYKSTSKSVSQIGAELGVEVVLEGSVRKAGDDLRITVQLINVNTQEHSWANSYDRKLEKVFAVQAEIAKRVAEALEIQLRPAEAARLEARPVVRPDSYLAYLRGRTLLHSFSRSSIESAKVQFELAISLDPNNAAAHSGLADALRVMVWWFPGVPRKSLDRSGRQSAARAIELDPNLAEGHASLALVLWDDLDYRGAEKEVKMALSLNPSYALAHSTYAAILEDEGRADEAIREFELAVAADPLSFTTQVHMTQLLIWLGRLEEAYLKVQRVGELEPTDPAQHFLLADYYLARSDRESALREIRLVEELRQSPAEKQLALALRYAVSGEREKLDALVRDATILSHPLSRFYIGMYYAELGDLDACFQWLDRRFETDGSIPFQRLRLDPRLENLRKDPRYQVLLKEMNLA